jgi:hypothetical protein
MSRILLTSVLLILVAKLQARNFYFVNQCNYKVWYGFVPGYGSPNLFPADNNYELDANGGKSSVAIPSNGWSGVIAGRTNCTASGCVTADCGGGTGSCIRGFMQPATQAEFTVSPTNVDFYDVEVINGINMPVSITPSVASVASDPYFCGAPGLRNPSAGLGGCTWDMKPPLDEYKWVENGGKTCTSNNDCTSSNTVCGLSFNPGYQQLLQKTCGNLLGYWSADQICGVQRDYGTPFDCSDSVPNQASAGITWWHLMACVDIGSCYQPNALSDCCGCVNWNEYGLKVPGTPYTEVCVNKNPNWTSRILPTLAWLKEACPTAYTYPYDDMSSTYTCKNVVNGENNVDYTITFCPNNV